MNEVRTDSFQTQSAHTVFHLVGSPNSGKTTLFNALTGSRQKTANYPGVTVEKKEGFISLDSGQKLLILDLPGTYSLSGAQSPDEHITAEVVSKLRDQKNSPQAIIAVADSTSLQTQLYLVLELLEFGIPVVLALTMTDLAKKNGIEINHAELEKRLGIPVVLVSAVKSHGLDKLKKQIGELTLNQNLKHASSASTSGLNSSDKIIQRYKLIEEITKACVRRKEHARNISRMIDRVVLHRVLGPVLLLATLALMFQAIFSFAEIPVQLLESGISLLQVKVRSILPESLLQSLIVDGVIAGVGAVIVFLPQILILFSFILFFEDSGYMARAAFVMDRLMSGVGLHGRAFIPLLSSFACAVPGIMATRTIENQRDRLTTILVAPLMTCSARIPVYTILVGAFIPNTPVLGFFTLQGLVLLGLYLAGVVAALFVALILRHSFFRREKTSFLMELPTYKMPAFRNIALGLWTRVKIFLRRAGTIILTISVVIWALASFPKATPPKDSSMSEKEIAAYQLEHSFAGKAGKAIEPLIRPLGFDWKIGVGILASLAAREVVLSTLGTVYAVGYEEDDSTALAERLKADPNFSLASALSLLVFYILACQCISTLAVTRRETNSWRWPAFMFGYMTVLAYGAAFFTYSIAKSLILL